jgi:hypothetical protein
LTRFGLNCPSRVNNKVILIPKGLNVRTVDKVVLDSVT